MVHATKSEAETNTPDDLQFIKQDLVLSVTPISSEPKYTTVGRQVVCKAMCETPSLASTKATGLSDVATWPKITTSYACMTAKSIMDVYRLRPRYIPICKLCKGARLPVLAPKSWRGPKCAYRNSSH